MEEKPEKPSQAVAGVGVGGGGGGLDGGVVDGEEKEAERSRLAAWAAFSLTHSMLSGCIWVREREREREGGKDVDDDGGGGGRGGRGVGGKERKKERKGSQQVLLLHFPFFFFFFDPTAFAKSTLLSLTHSLTHGAAAAVVQPSRSR